LPPRHRRLVGSSAAKHLVASLRFRELLPEVRCRVLKEFVMRMAAKIIVMRINKLAVAPRIGMVLFPLCEQLRPTTILKSRSGRSHARRRRMDSKDEPESCDSKQAMTFARKTTGYRQGQMRPQCIRAQQGPDAIWVSVRPSLAGYGLPAASVMLEGLGVLLPATYCNALKCAPESRGGTDCDAAVCCCTQAQRRRGEAPRVHVIRSQRRRNDVAAVG